MPPMHSQHVHMPSIASLLSLIILALVGLVDASSGSGKRGLVFTPNKDHPQDNQIWRQQGSVLSWYYNYGALPSPIYAGIKQNEFEFVPMMWGVGPNPKDDQWLGQVKGLIADGRNISHALAFNEPDAPNSWGGSDVEPQKAAQAWVTNLEPLAKMGVRLGLPACTGRPEGLVWLKQFLANCSAIVSEGSSSTKNCTWHVLPVHWYDNFEGLTSHINERRALWPQAEIWVTEYAYAHQELEPTQAYFNKTIDSFDKENYLGRYSYFGAFRSKNSSIGPNAPFLNNAGKLTDIGSWYLGGKATNVLPQSRGPTMAVPGIFAVSTAIIMSLAMAFC